MLKRHILGEVFLYGIILNYKMFKIFAENKSDRDHIKNFNHKYFLIPKETTN